MNPSYGSPLTENEAKLIEQMAQVLPRDMAMHLSEQIPAKAGAEQDKYSAIPSDTMESIRDYVERGVPVGNFLHAVLTNNLRDAVFGADKHNSPALKLIVSYLHWEVPGSCWGSPERYKAWLMARLKDNLKLSCTTTG